MLRRNSVNYAVVSILADLALTVAALLLASHIRSDGWLPVFRTETLPAEHLRWGLYPLIVLIWSTIFVFASVYDPSRTYRAVDELQRVLGATSAALLLLAGVLYLSYRLLSRGLFLVFAVLDLHFLVAWRLTARWAFRRARHRTEANRILIVGGGEMAQAVGVALGQSKSARKLVGFLHDEDDPESATRLGRLDEAREVVSAHRIDEVVTALPSEAREDLERVIRSLHDQPVRIHMVPDYAGLALYRARVEDLGGLPLISLRDPALNDVQRLLKRCLDLVVACSLLVLLSPILGLIALLVKLDSKGPVIFRQARIGEDGRAFAMLKFRSMVAGSEERQEDFNRFDSEGRLVHKHPDDPRVTRVGRMLRRTSLDELPQLWNVILGEMSMVGPRPELPWLVDEYSFWQRQRFAVPQGITGWWQIHGRSNRILHHHTEDDLYYIQNYSLWLDLYILLRTPLAVFLGKGAH